MIKYDNGINISTSCALDCWDSCSIMATVVDSKIVSLRENSRQRYLQRLEIMQLIMGAGE